jgi:predicted nucleotidyltransferase
LRNPDPGDVDLLVVYDPTELPPAEAAGLRGVFVGVCAKAAIHPVDVVLLTGDEARDTDFPAKESAELIFEAC